jgi:hypothetical protein
MNNKQKLDEIEKLKVQLTANKTKLGLTGLDKQEKTENLAKQLLDSMRRVEYITYICTKTYTGNSISPYSPIFDPYKLISNLIKIENHEEAYWLCFLTTYCGKNLKYGWSSLRTIYGGDKDTGVNNWQHATNNKAQFLNWLDDKCPSIKTEFGNHRKYETFKPTKGKGPRDVINSYLSLIESGSGSTTSSQVAFFKKCETTYGNDPEDLFDALYKKEASKILRFGRLSKFDYLTLLRKVGLIKIEPPEAYIGSSTGPKSGMSLLFLNNANISKPASWHKLKMNELKILDLGPIKMQVLEDAICNWQKAPCIYKYFRG